MTYDKERREPKPLPQAESLVELTPAEWEIMKVVWEKQPCAAGTVQESLAESRRRAYGTVKTTMDRMVEKGLLKTQHIRNLNLFSSCVSEVEAKRGAFRKMLKRAFDGAFTSMIHFLIENEELPPEEASQLSELANRAPSRMVRDTHPTTGEQGPKP